MSFDPTLPFVLADDAQAGRALLFAAPRHCIVAERPEQVEEALAALREGVEAGAHVAGFLAYEAGLALEARLAPLARTVEGPLLWFGLFDARQAVDAAALLAPFERPCSIGQPVPRMDQGAHAAAVARIEALIAAGDIYQANLTFQAEVAVSGHPLALYARLRRQARAPHGALLFTGREWLLSSSPELFFRCGSGRLTARPMKGTAARRADPAADRAAAETLRADPKNRAENLMITDLIRNDFSRVARPGSVAVPAPFAIETYPGIHQMTSTVTAELAKGRDTLDALAALFPCGSITGAPKIRAMEVITEVEPEPRGAYCGSIGWIAPGLDGQPGDAWFNVAIRTLALPHGSGAARLGLGSGIVADSDADDEWRECLNKSGFLTQQRPRTLIETMRVEDGVAVRLERHLERMAASAARFGFRFDAAVLRERLSSAASRVDTARLRVLLAEDGATVVQLSALPSLPDRPVDVRPVPLPVPADDWRLRHKTSDRDFYDDARREAGSFEVIFVRPDGLVTEGSFTSIFIERDGRLLTPPADVGLLPGVLRAELLETGAAVEAPLTRDDLSGGFLIGNSLRGLLRARLDAPQHDA